MYWMFRAVLRSSLLRSSEKHSHGPVGLGLAACFAAGLLLVAPLRANLPHSHSVPGATILMAQDGGLDFEALAQDSLRRRGLADRTPETFDFREYCSRDFVHLEVGLFDLFMEEASFGERKHGERFFQVAASLARLQVDWLDWVDPADQVAKEQEDIAKDLVKFLESVSMAGLAEASASTGEAAMESREAADLWTRLEVKEDRLATFRELAEYLQTDGGLGLQRERTPEPIVLYPDRGSYVELIAVAGWARPEARSRMWSADVFTWTNFYVNEWRFVSMEYGVPNADASSYRQGIPMESRSATGLEQQICQLASLGLFDNYFGGRIPPAVAGGLSVNLVIDLFGECNTRVDGDLRERRKEAREMFVPGGLSEGGVLPPNLADSRWREFHGKHRFLRILKESQKKGASAVKGRDRKDKVRYFELIADDEIERTVTEAPVLGKGAKGLGSLPNQFYGDRLEFARSYSSGFLYWLREKGGGRKAKDSHLKFASLLRTFANSELPDSGGILAAEPESNFDEVFAGEYDRLLSDPDLDPKVSLEGAFLHWLPKGR